MFSDLDEEEEKSIMDINRESKPKNPRQLKVPSVSRLAGYSNSSKTGYASLGNDGNSFFEDYTTMDNIKVQSRSLRVKKESEPGDFDEYRTNGPSDNVLNLRTRDQGLE